MQEYNNELYHYGVLGMKLGVHRSAHKIRANFRLNKKAARYDLKAERLTRKSEQMHAKYDLKKINKFQAWEII